eukprot:m.106045 g.106045  ORF g.106045 m.106045 type:complete len:154 (+) comp12684_c0_seq2:133-594(+)
MACVFVVLWATELTHAMWFRPGVVPGQRYTAQITVMASNGCVNCRIYGPNWGDRTGVFHSTNLSAVEGNGDCPWMRPLVGDGQFRTYSCTFVYNVLACSCTRSYCTGPCRVGRDALTGGANARDEPMIGLGFREGSAGSYIQLRDVQVYPGTM